MNLERNVPNTVGLTRSTLSNHIPDPDEEALTDLFHWIWSWKLQLARLVESTTIEGSGATPIEQRQSFSRTSYDEHQLIVVGWNVTRAIRRASKRFPQISIEERTGTALRLLRDLYEHWDEQRVSFQDANGPKARSGRKFVELFPEGRPWSVTYLNGDWLLGGVISIADLDAELSGIEATALKLQEQRKRRPQSRERG